MLEHSNPAKRESEGNLDRTQARLIEKRAVALLAPLAKELNLVVKPSGGTIGETHYTMKVEFSEVAADGAVCSAEAEAFKHYAKFIGLSAEDLGREFTFGGETYTILGYRPKATKNPIVVESRRGARYVFPVDSVKRALLMRGS